MRFILLFLPFLLILPGSAQDQSGPTPQEIQELVRKLGSDDLVERDDATRKLKEVGAAAEKQLREVLEEGGDAEAVSRARVLLLRIELDRGLSRHFKEAFPGIADQLAGADDHAWTNAFLKARAQWTSGNIQFRDWEILAGRALRGAKTNEELDEVCSCVHLEEVRSAWPELVAIIESAGEEAAARVGQTLRALRMFEAVPALARLLESEKVSARENAATVLIGLKDPSAVPKVVALLESKDAGVRQSVVRVLGGLAERGTIETLKKGLGDPDAGVRATTAKALATAGATDSVPLLKRLLVDPEPAVKIAAVEALGSLDAADSAPDMCALLNDSDQMVRLKCIRTLGELGNKQISSALVPLLGDPDRSVRSNALQALKELEAREELDFVRPLLKDKDPWVQTKAVEAYGALAPASEIPKVLEFLGHQQALVPGGVHGGLRKRDPKEVVPHLIRLLRHENPKIRDHAVELLREFKAAKAAKDVIPLLADPDSNVQRHAASLLTMLAPRVRLEKTEVIKPLRELLQHSAPSARKEAARLLGLMGARDTADHLILLLKDEQWDVRREAVNALALQGCRKAVPHLARLLREDKAELVVMSVLRALSDLDATECLPAIRSFLSHEKRRLRLTADSALRRMKVASTAEELVKELAAPEPDRRVAALELLEDLGASGQTQAIAPLLKDENPKVRASAAEAILALRPNAHVSELVGLLFTERHFSVILPVIQALAEVKSRAGLGFLRQGLKEGPLVMKVKFLEVVHKWEDRSFLGEIRPFLKDESDFLRANAAAALGELGDEEAIPDLLRLVEDPARRVRYEAMKAVSKMRAPGGARALVKVLTLPDCWGMSVLPRYLGEMGDKSVIPDLEKLCGHWDGQVRERAVEALGHLGSAESAKTVAEALKDRSWKVRRAAAESLARILGSAAVPRLLPLLEDEDADVVNMALSLLGDLRAKEAIPVVVRLLGDESRFPTPMLYTRGYPSREEDRTYSDPILLVAAHALAFIGDKEAIPVLKGMQDKAIPDHAAKSLAFALCWLGEKEGVLSLLALSRDGRGQLHDSGSSFRGAYMIGALNALGNPKQWERLSEMKLEEDFSGTAEELLQVLAKKAGMRLEMAEPVADRRPYRSFIPDTKRKHVVSNCWGKKSVMQALLESADHLYMAVILDGNRIRVTRFDDALHHWEMWWPWYQWYLKVKDQPEKPADRPEY